VSRRGYDWMTVYNDGLRFNVLQSCILDDCNFQLRLVDAVLFAFKVTKYSLAAALSLD